MRTKFVLQDTSFLMSYGLSPVEPSWHGAAEMGMGEALKAVVARVKKLYSSINATHPLALHVALLYHRLPVVRFQVC